MNAAGRGVAVHITWIEEATLRSIDPLLRALHNVMRPRTCHDLRRSVTTCDDL
jgi:hypothetical protein